MAQTQPDQEAITRIRRLGSALGTGPHSAEISLFDHVRGVLEVLGDQAAIALLDADSTLARKQP